MNNGPKNDGRYRNPEKTAFHHSITPFMFKFSLEGRPRPPRQVRKRTKRGKIDESTMKGSGPLDCPSNAKLTQQKETAPIEIMAHKEVDKSPSVTKDTYCEGIDIKQTLSELFDYEAHDVGSQNLTLLDEFLDKDKLLHELRMERDFWRENYYKVFNEFQLSSLGGTVTHTTIYKKVTEISSPPRIKTPTTSPVKLPSTQSSTISPNKLMPRRLQYL